MCTGGGGSRALRTICVLGEGGRNSPEVPSAYVFFRYSSRPIRLYHFKSDSEPLYILPFGKEWK